MSHIKRYSIVVTLTLVLLSFACSTSYAAEADFFQQYTENITNKCETFSPDSNVANIDPYKRAEDYVSDPDFVAVSYDKLVDTFKQCFRIVAPEELGKRAPIKVPLFN